jgi:peptidyl-prolyl cis-trans isomerase B (cyclophilin B)
MRAWLLGLISLLVLFTLIGCEGSLDAPNSGNPSSVRVSPSNITLREGQSINFIVFSDGGRGDQVQWSATGGIVDANGRYTAPTVNGTYTITARFTNSPTVIGTATVVVTDRTAITLTPLTAPVLSPGAVFQFGANVTNASNSSVLWTATGGFVDTNGRFRADDVSSSYTITARSFQDPTVFTTISGTITRTPVARMVVAGRGEVLMSLNANAAPRTVANFVQLANSGFYNGIRFHRYVPSFVIQGGDPQTRTLDLDDPAIGQGGPGYTIPFENSPLVHNKYAVAMALTSVRSNTGGSQFYITLEPQPTLDGDYCVFGNVTSGQAVVDALRRGDTITSITIEAP